MQIKELEDSLGTPLLERSARTLRLTPFGEDFLTRARAILRQTEELEDLARAARAELTGRLRIGVIPTVAPYLLPRLIARLTTLYPALDLTLRETITPRLLRDLAEGRLDCALLALPVSEPGLEEVALFSESFMLVRPLADAQRPVPSPRALREMRLLLLEEGHCFRDQALSFCATDTAAPREMMDGSSLSTLVQMVGAGIGVTLIPEMAVPVETRSAPVSVAAFPDPQPRRTIGMVWRRSTPLAPQLRQIAEVVREVA
jgi:LysR family hydrogen peroxide-inducible transcriptional activator